MSTRRERFRRRLPVTCKPGRLGRGLPQRDAAPGPVGCGHSRRTRRARPRGTDSDSDGTGNGLPVPRTQTGRMRPGGHARRTLRSQRPPGLPGRQPASGPSIRASRCDIRVSLLVLEPHVCLPLGPGRQRERTGKRLERWPVGIPEGCLRPLLRVCSLRPGRSDGCAVQVSPSPAGRPRLRRMPGERGRSCHGRRPESRAQAGPLPGSESRASTRVRVAGIHVLLVPGVVGRRRPTSRRGQPAPSRRHPAAPSRRGPAADAGEKAPRRCQRESAPEMPVRKRPGDGGEKAPRRRKASISGAP